MPLLCSSLLEEISVNGRGMHWFDEWVHICGSTGGQCAVWCEELFLWLELDNKAFSSERPTVRITAQLKAADVYIFTSSLSWGEGCLRAIFNVSKCILRCVMSTCTQKSVCLLNYKCLSKPDVDVRSWKDSPICTNWRVRRCTLSHSHRSRLVHMQPMCPPVYKTFNLAHIISLK